MSYNWTKYNNKKITVDGQIFDSKKEANRYKELRLLEKAGEIYDLRRQVKFKLIPTQRDEVTGEVVERECSYKADFVYEEAGETVVEDVNEGIHYQAETDVIPVRDKNQGGLGS